MGSQPRRLAAAKSGLSKRFLLAALQLRESGAALDSKMIRSARKDGLRRRGRYPRRPNWVRLAPLPECCSMRKARLFTSIANEGNHKKLAIILSAVPYKTYTAQSPICSSSRHPAITSGRAMRALPSRYGGLSAPMGTDIL